MGTQVKKIFFIILNLMINIETSFIHFLDEPTEQDFPKNNSWRTNIKSVLSTKDKKFFLAKECRSEAITERPFSNINRRFEFLLIIEDEKSHI